MDRAIRIATLIVLIAIAAALWSILSLMVQATKMHTWSPDTKAVRVQVVQ